METQHDWIVRFWGIQHSRESLFCRNLANYQPNAPRLRPGPRVQRSGAFWNRTRRTRAGSMWVRGNSLDWLEHFRCHMGVSKNRGTPQFSSIYRWDFPWNKPSSYWGSPIYESPISISPSIHNFNQARESLEIFTNRQPIRTSSTFFWVNYNYNSNYYYYYNSPTWILRPWLGMISLT